MNTSDAFAADDFQAFIDKGIKAQHIGSEGWLRLNFPDKDWHRHPRTDGRTDLCDGTPSDCAERPKV